jgi:ribosome biogenesis GTPase A
MQILMWSLSPIYTRLLLHIQTTKKKQDEHSAAHYFLSLFQEGKLGRFTLDPVPDDPDSLL